MTPTLGAVLRQQREVRGLTASETARGAGISAAYVAKLENDEIKRPSPMVLRQLGDVLGIPYADLMVLAGYPVPGLEEPDAGSIQLKTTIMEGEVVFHAGNGMARDGADSRGA